MPNRHLKTLVAQRLAEEHVKEKLEQMTADVTLNTTSIYSPDSEHYPDHRISFVDRHLDYLLNHPKLDSSQYLANLRMKIRSR